MHPHRGRQGQTDRHTHRLSETDRQPHTPRPLHTLSLNTFRHANRDTSKRKRALRPRLQPSQWHILPFPRASLSKPSKAHIWESWTSGQSLFFSTRSRSTVSVGIHTVSSSSCALQTTLLQACKFLASGNLGCLPARQPPPAGRAGQKALREFVTKSLPLGSRLFWSPSVRPRIFSLAQRFCL